MTTHIHWLVFAYNGKRQEPMRGEVYIDSVAVDVICQTLGEALERAEMLVPGRLNYEVNHATEHLEGHCREG